MRSTQVFCALMTLLVLASLAGCEGHGKYTQEFLDQAKENMARLHSATQYDLAVQQFNSGDLKRSLETIECIVAVRTACRVCHPLIETTARCQALAPNALFHFRHTSNPVSSAGRPFAAGRPRVGGCRHGCLN